MSVERLHAVKHGMPKIQIFIRCTLYEDNTLTPYHAISSLTIITSSFRIGSLGQYIGAVSRVRLECKVEAIAGGHVCEINKFVSFCLRLAVNEI